MTSRIAAMRPLTTPEITSSPLISSTPEIPTPGPTKEGGASGSPGPALRTGGWSEDRRANVSMNIPVHGTAPTPAGIMTERGGGASNCWAGNNDVPQPDAQ